MSDSLPPDETSGDNAPPPRRGGWADIEDGVGQLFAALERGALNLADAEGRRRRGEPPATGDESDDASAGSDAEPEPAAVTGDEEPTEPEPVPARPGMTYDEVLTPIRWRNLAIGAFVVVVLAAVYWGISLVQVIGAADDSSTDDADAIVVLGAAQFDGTPSPVLAARLDHALALWNAGRAEVIITTGSNQEGDRFTEGFSGFVYLRDAGVPEDDILTIVDGDDTYQQLTAAQAQLVERSLDTALLVSDGYHSYRLRAIADEIGLAAVLSPTSVDATTDDYVREATAVSVGRLVGFRRLSAWNTAPDDVEVEAGE